MKGKTVTSTKRLWFSIHPSMNETQTRCIPYWAWFRSLKTESDQEQKTTTGIYLTLDSGPYTNFWVVRCKTEFSMYQLVHMSPHNVPSQLSQPMVWTHDQRLPGDGFQTASYHQPVNNFWHDMHACQKLRSLFSHNQMRILFWVWRW